MIISLVQRFIDMAPLHLCLFPLTSLSEENIHDYVYLIN